MSEGPARIESPEIIRDFRRSFAAFDNTARNALLGVDSDVKGVSAWLRSEQLTYWKQQIRRREEAANVAAREYTQARMTASQPGRSSGVEELRALEKAKRLKEEAERKIEAVKKWSMVLDQQVAKMIRPCNVLGILLDQLTPRALGRLDQMVVSLEEYLRTTPGEAAP